MWWRRSELRLFTWEAFTSGSLPFVLEGAFTQVWCAIRNVRSDESCSKLNTLLSSTKCKKITNPQEPPFSLPLPPKGQPALPSDSSDKFALHFKLHRVFEEVIGAPSRGTEPAYPAVLSEAPFSVSRGPLQSGTESYWWRGDGAVKTLLAGLSCPTPDLLPWLCHSPPLGSQWLLPMEWPLPP